jgi:hypothetical protein
MELQLYRTTTIEPYSLLLCLVGVIFILVLAIFLNYRYKWFKKYKQLKESMVYLDLNQEEENLLAGMIERSRLEEPVKVLFSLPLFDDLATKEIRRVLCTPGSSKAKQAYIQLVYDIRQRTFFPDWNVKEILKT